MNAITFREMNEVELQEVEGGLGILAIAGIVAVCVLGATFLGMLGYGIYDGYVTSRDEAQAA